MTDIITHQDGDELEYATISGARGVQMRDELSFAVSHPTHGEVNSDLKGDHENETSDKLQEVKQYERNTSIKNLLNLAHHRSNTTSILADEIIPEKTNTRSRSSSVAGDSTRINEYRRHKSLSLAPLLQELHNNDTAFHVQKCQEALEALELVGKAVTVSNSSLGHQVSKNLKILTLSLQKIEENYDFESGASHLKNVRKMARHINAEVVKARRSKWNQMLGYHDQSENLNIESPAKTPQRRNLSILSFWPVSSEKKDDKQSDSENEQKEKKRPSITSLTYTGISGLFRFLRTNLFTSTAPALILCLAYFIVILVLGIHEDKHYSTEHIHALPYTTYLKAEPLTTVEVEIRFATGIGHRKANRRKLLRKLLSSDPILHSQYMMSLEQMSFANSSAIEWTSIRTSLLQIYEGPEVSQFYKIRPEKSRLRIKGAPLRLTVSCLEDHKSAYVDVHQLGWIGEAQTWIAFGILLVVLLLIAVEIVNRVIVAMMGSFLMLLLLICTGRPPTLVKVVEWVDESTLGLLFGMMIMVGKLSATGFFEVSTLSMIGFSKGRKWWLFVILCLLTAALSAFLDNVTTVLLIAPATLELCKNLQINPLPLLVGEILFSNIGGAATMIGDPPNIIVGNALSSELTFMDFLAVLAPGVLLMTPFALLLLRYIYRNDIIGTIDRMDVVEDLKGKTKIEDLPLFYKSIIVLGVTILLFVLHPVHHCDPAWIAIIGAGTIMLTTSPHDIHHDLEYVEWDTLIFFASLFVMVEAMGEVGLIRSTGYLLTDIISAVPESRRVPSALTILMWASALISGFLDNIPYTATMVPIIQQLSNAGLGLEIKPLAFALCFGACLGGNGSLVGASANIVVAGIANRMGHNLTFTNFIKVSFPVMLLTVAIANGYLVLRYN